MRRNRIVFAKTHDGQPALYLDMRLSRKDERALHEWGLALMKHEHDRLVSMLEFTLKRMDANVD